ncbi:hypothetical protein [Microaceticoccus formicicus]|uniref:hypothetical protein n=1 Tax=Microaceticoccus formicicus TaxID=3118105 RepID=UPI003CD03D66|nr:hypothetical protein VZL98_02615 [Peptoniphilaceae bacterium AMB_02]
MRSILNLVLDHQSKTTIFPLASLFAILGVYLIYWISNRNKYIKYVPGLILISIGIYNLVEGLPKITDETGLNMILRFGIFFVSGFVALCYALILGIINKSRVNSPNRNNPFKSIFKRKNHEK